MANGPYSDSKGQYVVVVYGDTLSKISETHYGGASKYAQLAKANGISNPNLIYVGQKIYLTGSTSGSSSGSTSTTTNTVTNIKLGLLASEERTLYLSWDWGKEKQTEKYRLKWSYKTKENLTFTSMTDINVDQDYPAASRMASYKIPTSAEQVSVQILPISAEYSKVSTKIVNGLVQTTTTTMNSSPQSASGSSSSGSSDSGSVLDKIKEKWPLNGTGSGGSVATQSQSSTTSSTIKTTYWTASWSPVKTFYTSALPPETPSAPEVTIDDLTLTATLKNIDTKTMNATHIEFRVILNDSSVYNSGAQTKLPIKVISGSQYGDVAFVCTVKPGGKYKVSCRAWRNSLCSDWSSYSENKVTKPNAPKGFDICRADSQSSIYLKWTAVATAKSYDIEYATKRENFDLTTDTTVVSVEDKTEHKLTNLDSGKEYFLRIRANNGESEDGYSDWSEISSAIVGTTPNAPTTWSSTSTATVGGPLTLYWVHNSKDGSWQTEAYLKITIDGLSEIYKLAGPGRYSINGQGTLTLVEEFTKDEDKYNTCSCTIDTTRYSEGVKMEWQMQTAGVTGVPGEYSTKRTIDIYASPEFTMFEVSDPNGVIDEGGSIQSFPIKVNATVGPQTQTPVGFYFSIVANDTYETVDNLGNDTIVTAGEEIFTRYVDSSVLNEQIISAGDVNLEPSQSYTLRCTAAMNSGLTAEAVKTFVVSWTDLSYSPDAEIAVNMDTYTATITPYCMSHSISLKSVGYRFDDEVYYVESDADPLDETSLDGVFTTVGDAVSIGIDKNGLEIYYCIKFMDDEFNPIPTSFFKVNRSDDSFVTTTEEIDKSTIKDVVTETGEQVLIGMVDGIETLYCSVDSTELVPNVKLSVYRREFDGTFTPIATDIDNQAIATIPDPHPSLDYARYRIVATEQTTGAVSYYDLPGYPVGGKSIVIQWDEAWSAFDVSGRDELTKPLWSGSLIELRYNIDVTNKHQKEVSTVGYIGRSHPVSYYGTQLGETSSWSVEIPKQDVDTIYALRRLSKWMGDVYVREPSGIGYWATIAVSFPIKHNELTIPISFDITRVEGGM